MKVSDEDKVLIGVGGLAILGLFFLWKKKKEQQTADELANYIPEPETASSGGGGGSSSSSKPVQGATLDRNKLLKAGSKGLEVRELQRLLGVEIDGDFGKITLAALQNEKGVSEISLNAFASTVKKKVAKPLKTASQPKVTLPKAGQKLMAAKDNTVIFISKKRADGKYYNSGSKFRTLDYGDEAGAYVGPGNNGQYLIKIFGFFAFVKGNEVTAY